MKKVYQCDTTDLRNDYPTDCPIGSLMIVKKSNHGSNRPYRLF